MNYRKLALLSFLVLSLAVFFTFALNAGDKSSKAVNGTVVCIDKGAAQTSHLHPAAVKVVKNVQSISLV